MKSSLLHNWFRQRWFNLLRRFMLTLSNRRSFARCSLNMLCRARTWRRKFATDEVPGGARSLSNRRFGSRGDAVGCVNNACRPPVLRQEANMGAATAASLKPPWSITLAVGEFWRSCGKWWSREDWVSERSSSVSIDSISSWSKFRWSFVSMLSLDSEPHVDQLQAKSLEKHTRIAAANKRHGTRISVLHLVADQTRNNFFKTLVLAAILIWIQTAEYTFCDNYGFVVLNNFFRLLQILAAISIQIQRTWCVNHGICIISPWLLKLKTISLTSRACTNL